MTRVEIERQVAAGGLTGPQVAEVWHALHLKAEEMEETLEHVRRHANHPWILAMACTAAYTWARRSELMRMRVSDVDFAGRTVIVREKKRSGASTRLAGCR